jgi:cytochrome c2
MKIRWFAALAALTLVSGMTLSAQDPKQIEAGKKVYDTYKCQKCHKTGEAGSKLSPLDGVATKLTADEIHQWLVSPDDMTAKLKKKPKVKMKKIDYKPGELDALMAYMLSLK